MREQGRAGPSLWNLGRLVPVVLLLMIGASDSWAQLQDQESTYGRVFNTPSSMTKHHSGIKGREERSSDRDAHVGDLPDWAESRTRSRVKVERTDEAASPTSGFETKDRRPGVPVDGGLIWLVLVGIGYGVFRLREEVFTEALNPA